MKWIFILISILSIESCKNLETSGVQKAYNLNNHTITFEYSVLSRGTFQKIKITKNQISILSKRNSKPIVKPCPEAQWNSVLNRYNTVRLKNIPKFEAPSKKFLFDGAPLAKLKITVDQEIYESVPFDHGNPPQDIAALVKEILSMAQNID